MARTKEFDPEVALESAMELFWRQGYEATTTAQLVDHLNISRASLYNAFGDKHGLYLASLDRYLTHHDPGVLELLSQSGPALPAVRALIDRYAHDTVHDEQRRGCLMVNAAAERLPADQAAASRVASGWDTVEVGLTTALLRARAQGELGEDRDPRAIARFLLVLLQGLRVLGRAAPAPQRVQDAVNEAMRVLD